MTTDIENWWTGRSNVGCNDLDFMACASFGQNEGFRTQYKFGYNPSVGATKEDIWAYGGIMQLLSTGEKMNIVSDDATDTAAGTGARVVYVEGLDDDYQRINETVILNGTTNVETANTYLRVHRMIIVSAGTDAQNNGNISATAVTAGTVQAYILPTLNQTTQSQWTIPDGYYAKVLGFKYSSSKGDLVQLKAELKSNGVWQTKYIIEAYQKTDSLEFPVSVVVPPRSDLKVTGDLISGTGTGSVTASYNMLLIDEAYVNTNNLWVN